MCGHRCGDYFQGMWICAICYTPMSERPTAYGSLYRGKEGPPQSIIWQASIAKDEAGTRFSTFLEWMIGYLRRRSIFTISKDDARQQCLEALRDMGEPFGSDGCTWDREDAHEIVKEDICSYWDDEGFSGQNS